MKLPLGEPTRISGNETESNGSFNEQHGQPVHLLPESVQDEHMKGAIDAMVSSSQQSYEDFLSCFSHFKPGESRYGESMDKEEGEVITPDMIHKMLSLQIGDQSIDAETLSDLSELSDLPGIDPPLTSHLNLDEDGIEQEVLEQGSVSKDPLLRPKGLSVTAQLQVDNFLSLEEELSESKEYGELYKSGYVPSLQKKGTPLESSDKTQSVTTTDVLTAVPKLSGIQKDNEVKDIDEASFAVMYDVARNTKKWEKFCQDLSDSEEDLEYDSRLDGLNPGEVETSEESRETIKNQTNLDFTTTFKHCDKEESLNSKTDESISTIKEITNVEAFSLDEHFDYDNVTLTPKFSSSEMEALANLLQQNIQPVQVPYAPHNMHEDDASEFEEQ